LEISREQKQVGSQEFDYLVLDAFNSDAIPVHLLTVEAFRLYEHALAKDGMLAVHVTNRHLDLARLVSRMGLEVGLESLVVQTHAVSRLQSQLAEWILMSKSKSRLGELAEFLRKRTKLQKLPPKHMALARPGIAELSRVPLWSDDYSDLLGVLRSN